MQRFLLSFIFVLFCGARSLEASPIHALTVDDQQMLVPDDYDATQYYHLAPNFNNHIYFETDDDGSQRAWGFLDLEFATLIVWWNNSLHDEDLYDNLGQTFPTPSSLAHPVGYGLNTLTSANLGSSASPSEGEVALPDTKVSIGLGHQFSDNLALGICFQYSETELSGGLGAGSKTALNPISPASGALYLSNSPYYNDLTVSSYSLQQYSSAISFAPSLGINTEAFSLDLKGEMIFNSVQNSYSESDFDNAGDSGNISQGLQSNGSPSWNAMGRLRIPMGEGSLVLRGAYQAWNLDLLHSVSGSFSGSGFNSNQLAGYNQNDSSETYNYTGWNGMLGWVESFKPVNGLLVFGLGANGNIISQDYLHNAPYSASNLNSLYLSEQDYYNNNSWAVPFLLGGEISPVKYLRFSASAIRNLVGNSATVGTQDNYNSSGIITNGSIYNASADAPSDWDLNVGVGLTYSSFVFDMAVNSDFLGSESGFTQPIYESALTLGY